MIDKDTVIFDNISFSDLAKDIYVTKKSKDEQINIILTNISNNINNAGDAAIIMQNLSAFLEASVKNDELIIKLLAIIQRIIVSDTKNSDTDFKLSEKEIAELKNAIVEAKSY